MSYTTPRAVVVELIAMYEEQEREALKEMDREGHEGRSGVARDNFRMAAHAVRTLKDLLETNDKYKEETKGEQNE